MLLGARQFFAARKAAPAWTNPYVTDGLVAMWDGEWNAGGGVHDANATAWVDLSNNGHNLTIPSTIAFGDDYGMASDKGGAVIIRPSSVYDAIVSAGGYTIEAVFESSGVNGAIATIGNENTIYSFSTSRASFRASNKYNGSGTNLTLQYSNVTTSVAKKSWAMTVELGAGTILYENANVNRSVSSGGIAGLQYPQYVGIGLNSSYPGSNDGAGGKYYSVRLYSRALTAAEIAANYAIDKARFNLP